MDLRLTAARAVVTGGSRGIGFAVARGLLAEGARVALVTRDVERLGTPRTSWAARCSSPPPTRRTTLRCGPWWRRSSTPGVAWTCWSTRPPNGSIAGSIRNVAAAALTANLLGPAGVGVTVVHPGLVETERMPQLVADRVATTGRTEEQVRAELGAGSSLRRLVTAEEVANVVVFLCSPLAAAITGDAVGVGGGNRGVINY